MASSGPPTPDRPFWEDRWRERRIGFHRSEVNPTLVHHEHRLLGDEARTILVPLCGKSVDLLWLSARGHEVIGVEFVEQPILDLEVDHGIEFRATEERGGRVFRAAGLTVYAADFFTVELPAFDRVYDRAAFIAVAPERRAEYVNRIAMGLAPGQRVLLETCVYDTSEMADGPPHPATREDVSTFWGAHFDIEGLDEGRSCSVPEHLLAKGLTWIHRPVFLLTRS